MVRSLWCVALLCMAVSALAADPPYYKGDLTDIAVNENSPAFDIELSDHFTNATAFGVDNPNSALVSASISGSTLTIEPQAHAWGNVTLTVFATNAVGTTNAAFLLTVNPVPEITRSMTNVTVNEDASPTYLILSRYFTNGTAYLFNHDNANLLSLSLVSNDTLRVSYIANSNGSATITVVASNAYDTVQQSFDVDVTPVADAPEVLGVSSTIKVITDNNTIFPFTGVSVRDVDLPQLAVDVIVKMSGSTNGRFIGSAVGVGPGLFNLAGTNQPGTVALSNVPASTANSLFDQLGFEPTRNTRPVGSSNDTVFSIIVNSPSLAASVTGPPSEEKVRLAVTNSSTTVRVFSTNDAPIIDGVDSQPQLVFTGDSIKPFSGVRIYDADVSSAGSPAGQAMTVIVTLVGDTNGALLGGGFLRTNSSYTLSGVTQAAAQQALTNLVFQARSGPLSSPVQTWLQLHVHDELLAADNDTNTLVVTASPSVSPDITGTQSGQQVNDSAAKLIFSAVSIRGVATRVQIDTFLATTNNGNEFGELINLGSFQKVTNNGTVYYEFNGLSDDATAAIRQLAYKPVANWLTNGVQRVGFRITLWDGTNSVGADNRTSVDIIPINDLPALLGAAAARGITDKQTSQPFFTRNNATNMLVRVIDPDERGQQSLRVTVSLDDPAKGIFTTNSLAGFTVSNVGVYVFEGSADAASAALRSLIFQPVENRLPVGQNETVRFTVVLDDHQGQGVVVNNTTTLVVTSQDDPPGVYLGTNVFYVEIGATNIPFAAGSITDADAGPQQVTVTISIENPAKGSFSSLGAFTQTGPGTYTFIGTTNDATASLRGLQFEPNGGFASISGDGARSVNVTVTARDSQNQAGSVTATFVIRGDQKTFIVSNTDDDGAGSLRDAVRRARSNDQIVFSLPTLPALIRLASEIVVDKNLAINGPGADRLTISGDTDGDGVADVRIFNIENGAHVLLRGLALTRATHPFSGGAISVGPSANLQMEFCSISFCSAGQWGGAVDVDEGSLTLTHSLIYSNTTSTALGQGGGGVSLYTLLPCAIANTTFSGNRQASISGFGGGGLYIENFDPGEPFAVRVVNCTFSGNSDVSNLGSAIKASAFNLVATVQNTIMADGSGKNMEVEGGAQIISAGGNVSDDETRTVFSQGGAPVDVILFDQASDKTNRLAKLGPLANNGGPTWTHALLAASPALGNARSNEFALDQRGFLRDSTPDSGAFDTGSFKHFVINEVLFAPTNGADYQFIEFYNSRDSETNDISGFQVWVDGTLRHTFTGTNTVLAPGVGMVLRAPSNNFASSTVPSQIASNGLFLSTNSSIITLKDAKGRDVLSVFYYGTYDGSSALFGESVQLVPEFFGWSYVPYSMMNTNPLLHFTPGGDLNGLPLGAGNAPPIAFNDSVTVDEDHLAFIDVLANDFEADRLDNIWVTAVHGDTSNAVVAISDTPRLAGGVTFDPRTSTLLQSLPEGAETVVTFQYEIIDFCCDVTNGVAWPRDPNWNNYTGTVAVTVMGVNDAPTPANDSFITAEDTAQTINVQTGLLANDSDPDTDDDNTTLLIAGVHSSSNYVAALDATTEKGAHVTLLIRADRNLSTVTYDPRGSAILNALAVNESTDDTFYYSVIDSHGAIGTAKVTVHVTGVNDTPGSAPDIATTFENVPITIPQHLILANDVDPDTDDNPTLRISFVSSNSALGARVTIVGTNVVYDPTMSSILNALARKERASDAFTYVADDGNGGATTNIVTVTVIGVNDTPVAGNDAFSFTEDDVFVSGITNGLLVNDFDYDIDALEPNDRLSALVVSNLVTRLGGVVSIAADGRFTFDATASAYYNGLAVGMTASDSFTYVVRDRSFTFANDDVFTVVADGPGGSLNVLANDVILSGTGGALSIVSVSTPDNGGTATIDGGTNIVYVPAINFYGPERFTYTVTDGQGASDTATVLVNVTIRQLNGNLGANDDAYTVAAGTTATLAVLGNDRLPATATTPLAITSVGTPNQGGSVSVVTLGSDSAIRYTPAASGPALPYVETFTYDISGGGTAHATATVRVSVTSRAGTLAVNADSFSVLRGSANNALDVLANDVLFPSGSTGLTITTLYTNGMSGLVTIHSPGDRLTYTPAVSGPATDSFEYECTDARGATGRAVVNVRISNGGLFANADQLMVIANSSNNVLPVLRNDNVLPSAGQTLTVSYIGTPDQGGTVTNDPTFTTLVYTPAPGYVGAETFAYEISDGGLSRAAGTVTVIVTNRTGSLATKSDVFSVAQSSSNNVLRVLDNDGVAPGNALNWKVSLVSTTLFGGTVELSGAGANNFVLYTPPANFIGEDSFSYTVSDGKGGTGTSTVAVKVGDIVVNNDEFTALTGTTNNVLAVLANDFLLGGTSRSLHLASVGAPDQGGTVQVGSNGLVALYAPDPNFDSLHPSAIYPYTETFAYTAIDDTARPFSALATVHVYKNGSDRATGTVNVVIIGRNDAPTIAGTSTGLGITDKQTIAPFTGVSIGDVDEFGQQQLTVRIALDTAVKGVLSNSPAFAQTAPGVYTCLGTGSNITAAIRQLIFVPTENRITVPTTELTRFTITANDGLVTVTNNSTTVAVSAVNDAPVISGTVAGVRVYNRSMVRPFYATRVSDVDDSRAQPQTVTITLSDATHGYFTALSGFVQTGPGTYRLTNATPAMATAALEALLFVPTTSNRVSIGVFETTRLTITVNDGFATAVVDTNTTVVAIDGLVARLQASDRLSSGQNVTRYGNAVAATRDYVAVGEPMDDHNGNSGSAFIYSRRLDGSEAWDDSRKLYPTNASSGDQFGYSIALSGDYLVVGAPQDRTKGNGAGAIYIFARNQTGTNNWSIAGKLTASDGAAADEFGCAVAIDGDTIAVGSRGDDDKGSSSGSVYVFTRSGTNWTQSRKIVPADGAAGDQIGYSVSIYGDLIVAGAPFRTDNAIRSGAAYLFSRNQGGSNVWGQVKKFLPADQGTDDRFGWSVGIDRDIVAVGAPLKDAAGADSGAAYVFAQNQGGSNVWGQVKRLVASDIAGSDQFGYAVSVDRDNIVVGSPYDDDNGTDSGSAYLFSRNAGGTNQWNQAEKYVPNLSAPNGNFGFSLSAKRNTLIVGAPFDATDNGTKYGAMYIFRLKFNNAPGVVNPIANQTATRDTLFTFTVPANTFGDPDISDSLIYSASRSTGAALPAWLTFNAATATFNGTPGAADLGTVSISVRVTDEDGESASNTFVITVVGTSAMENWQIANFGNATVANPAAQSTLWGDTADPDGDGLDNWTEYVLGTDPTVAGAASLKVTISRNSNTGRVWANYNRRTNDPQLYYHLEVSSDFVTWTSAAPVVLMETAIPISGEFEQVTADLDPSVAARFFRIKVDRNP